MSAEKCRNDVERLLGAQFLVQPENFQLARNIQTVAAFCFYRRRAIGGELRKGTARPLFQSFRRCGAQFLYGVEDPAALASDFLVACPSDLQLILFRPAGGVDQMRMRVDKPREHNAAAEVQLFGAGRVRQRLDFRASSDGSDEAVVDEQSSVFEDAEIGECCAASRPAAAQRQQLRCARDEQGICQGPAIMPDASQSCTAVGTAILARVLVQC